MNARVIGFMLAAATPCGLLAQVNRADSTRRITGVVYDSVARAPLAGAVVEAIPTDPEPGTVSPRVFSAISDTAGRYDLAGLPSGSIALRFTHDVLTLLDLESPVRLVTLGDSDIVRNLGIPSGAVVVAGACSAGNPADGMLAGYVTRAQTGEPVARSSIVVRWEEVALERGRLGSVRHEAKGVTDDAGRYRVCGIPSEGPVTLRVEAPRFRPFDSELTVAANAVTRLDLRLADTGSAAATSTLQLRVEDDSGRAVMGGQARVIALDREAAITAGEATIPDLPAGTWALAVRSLGFYPVVVPVNAPTVAPSTVKLERIPLLLDSVLIRSPRARGDSATIREIEARLVVGHGTIIRADNLAIRNSVEASDAIRSAHGFRWNGRTKLDARSGCHSIEHADTLRLPGSKEIAIYLNGSRVPGGIETVNQMVPPADILAIEAYPDVISAPFLWRTNDACAVIAFWTKR
jgi:hypothetical protein